MSVEVKVTRWVPDSVWTGALTALFDDIIRRAAEYADAYAPHDKGKLSQSLSPQVATKIDGGAWPKWATYAPKVTNPPYPGFLNAGGYVRTWVPPRGAIGRWGQLKGFDAATTSGIFGGMVANKGRPVPVEYHYVAQPRKRPPAATNDQYGLLTKGWFNPSVPKALKDTGDLQQAADAFAARIEKAWNGR